MTGLKTIFHLALCVCPLFSIVGGCVGVEEAIPEKHRFMLDVSRRGDVSSADPETVLEIRQFRVSPQYESTGFVYRTSDLKYETDFYNEFLVSPGPMFSGETQQWLVGSGLFQHVVDTSGRLQPTHVLEGSVLALYGDYADRQTPKAIMDVQFLLTHDVSGQYRIVFQKQYRKRISIRERYPEGLVNGWNRALEQILTDFENDLRAHVLNTGS